MKEQLETINRERFTVRVNEDVGLMIRHSYELNRNRRLLDGQKVLSLNEFLLQLITSGLDLETTEHSNREAFYSSIVSEQTEGAM